MRETRGLGRNELLLTVSTGGTREIMALSPAPSLKDRFTSLDTLALVRELRALGRWRVDKVFDRIGGGWILSLRVAGEGRRELILVPGRYAALIPEPIAHTEELSPMARDLRRLLSGAVAAEVAEPGGERYLEIQFQRADSPEGLTLALELFGTGNLLVARAGTIVAVAHAKTWAHRSVRRGATYQRPPTRLNPWTATAGELESEFLRSRSDRTHTLAARFALGGPLAEEVMVRSKLDGAVPASTDAGSSAGEVHRTIRELLAEVGERPKGYLYRSHDTLVDAEPFRSARWSTVPGVAESTTPTFGEAAQAFFDGLVTAVPSAPERETGPDQELLRQRDQQSSAVSQLRTEVTERQAQADTLFANYPEAERALAEAAREGGVRDRRVTISVSGQNVSVYRDRTIRESAQALYDEGKRVQAKLNGAIAALAETELRLQKSKNAEAAKAEQVRVKATVAPSRKAHWFEKYRWFISSEGAIVVAGRDATTNDYIVRRYLRDGDIYLHADIHGAASVIVKHPAPGEPDLSESTYREAGQWAVAYSKAWRAGLASAAAFWVAHDQVSKTGASGEFVAKGAWVIHGTKHVLSDLPLELAIGEIEYQGAALWTVAPPPAVRARGKVRFLLTPGLERERDEREVALARELDIPRSRLQSLLPAGGIDVRRA
jgi:predicted ribosome quality control (RQC) complex YloA/Tae2 family protein